MSPPRATLFILLALACAPAGDDGPTGPTIRATTDGVGTMGYADGTATRVTITRPAPGAVLADNPVLVEGRSDGPARLRVVVRAGEQAFETATADGGGFAVAVSLRDGDNAIVAEAGGARSEAVSVRLVSTLVLAEPADGAVIDDARAAARGFFRGEAPAEVEVAVDGETLAVPVAAGGFSVPLAPYGDGAHQVSVRATVGGRLLSAEASYTARMAAAILTRVHPSAGAPGTVISVMGKGFSAAGLSVTVAGVPADARATDDHNLTFTVPEDAEPGPGWLQVEAAGERFRPATFTVFVPGAWRPWTEETAERLPPDDGQNREEILAGDVDGDGDVDLYVVRGGDGPQLQNELWINDGAGYFRDQTGVRLPYVPDNARDGEIADVNQDGFPDVLAATTFAQVTRLYINDGLGFFTDETEARMSPPIRNFGCSVEFGDLDHDGDLDLVVTDYGADFVGGPTLIYMNRGIGFFERDQSRFPSNPELLSGVTLDVRLLDVDGDGDLDIVRSDREDQSDVFLNDGTGRFSHAPGALPPDSDLSYGFATGDMDLDGDEDLVWTDFGEGGQSQATQDVLLIADGRGRFSNAWRGRFPADHDRNNEIVLGDFDGDGDLDAFASSFTQGEPHRLFENRGRGEGVLVDRTDLLEQSNQAVGLGVDVLDIEGDGDLDIVTVNHISPNRELFVNHAVE